MSTLTGVVSYPIPLFQNMPIEAQFYSPGRFVITAISLGQTTAITTSTDHDYVIGQQVRILIPASFGTIQLNEKTGFVISIPSSTQVILDIPSADMDAFTSSSGICQPQILALGDINCGAINASGRINLTTYIPGSFINISPA